MNRCVVLLSCWGLMCVTGGARPSAHAADVTETADPVMLQTEQVLRRMAMGNDSRAIADLQGIVTDHPRAVLARWSLGLIDTGDAWVRYDRFVHETNRWPELFKYQQEREKRTDSFADQLFLADGCRDHNLTDEERAHLMGALQQNWNFEEAHHRLGHVNLGGTWVTGQQIERALLRQQRNAVNFARWQEPVQLLARQFNSVHGPGALKNFEARLNEIRTPDAIPAMEMIFAARSPDATMAYLGWLAGIESYEASQALARQAVFNDVAELRAAAQRNLRGKPWKEYVPWLLSGLESTKEIECSWQVDVGAALALRMVRKVVINGEAVELTVDQHERFIPAFNSPTVIRTNPDGSHSVSVRVPVSVGGRVPSRRGQSPGQIANFRTLIEQIQSQRNLQGWQQASQEIRTDRIQRALAAGTQVDSNHGPDDWWNWWREQNDYVLATGTKQKLKDSYEETWYVDRRRKLPVRNVNVGYVLSPFPSHSCFAAGTPVETEQGPKPIEQIQRGDRVLAQDIETGELAFKPVFETTRRDEASLLRIRTSSEDITCSIGHPFWIPGQGWTMARELEPGSRLHAVSGTAVVETIESAGTGSVYNLVVADAHTYFAGKERLYTHDVTRREPTDSILPGLRKEFK
jgi:hypothetical protein